MWVSNHMWTRVSNHIRTIFDHIWVFIRSLSLITYDTIYDIKTNHMPTCLQIICQIIYDFKIIYDLNTNHICLNSNHIWYYIKSYMILNHIWLPYMVLKQIICQIICLQIICGIIYTQSYTIQSYMVPRMIHDMVYYTCLSNHIYVPYVAQIYDYHICNHMWNHIWNFKNTVWSDLYEIICEIIYELLRIIYDLPYIKSYVKSYMNMWIKSYVKSYECRTYQNVCINYVYIHPNPNAISCP